MKIPFLLLCLLSTSGQEAAEPGKAALRFFEERVRPVLAERCFSCHSSQTDRIRGGLRLDTYEGLLKGGESGVAVVRGDPEAGLLIPYVRRRDKLRMPPEGKGERLSNAQISDLEAWIRMGAPYPDAMAGTGGEADRWAFRAVRPPAVPVPGIPPVDAFVNAKLVAKGLKPSPPADKATLLRRATFDLTGLPPTPQEVLAFLADDAPDAFEKVIDRLLASPRYGEQWARHWLDVVRYADTAGFSNDFERPSAWRYRDYVIRSLNDDKPFDRFILEQVAGDELALSGAEGLEPENPELRIAVGFLRMGPWEHTGMSVAAVTRQFFLDDVTHSVSATFLGLTMRCARCHDHKFDPIPTRDYYRLQACFAPVQFAERDAPFLPREETAGFEEGRATLERRLKEKGYREVEQPVGSDPKLVAKSLDKVGKKRREHFERELQRYRPLALSVYDGPPNSYSTNKLLNSMPPKRDGAPQQISVLKGGALDAPGDAVEAGVPSAVGPTAAIPQALQGRRLELARWIASRDNPLTARVIVNRAWQHHFGGKGLVATPNNLGMMGKRPSHPELLDWLASWFTREGGGSLKKLHRLIMTSAAYRRSSAPASMAGLQRLDPSNDLLSFYPARRLAAEEIRDAMLTVSGELRLTMGGPGIFPEINWEVALQPRHVMGGPAPAYQPSPRPDERHRRTIYACRIRTLADPMLEVLNQPGSEFSCERRDETTVAPQAFALFNGQFVHDRALAMAHAVERAAADDAARIDLAFRLVFARDADAGERTRCLDHLARSLERHRTTAPVRVEPPRFVRREMIEEFTGAVVRWDEELDAMREFVPDLKPWDVPPATRALAEVCLVLLNSNEFLYVR